MKNYMGCEFLDLLILPSQQNQSGLMRAEAVESLANMKGDCCRLSI